jgi:PAS domain S-box-containing protein
LERWRALRAFEEANLQVLRDAMLCRSEAPVTGIAETRLDPEDLAAILAEPTLASLHAAGAATFIARIDPPRVVWASPSAHAQFRTSEVVDLTRRLFDSETEAGRQLTELSRSLAPGRPPRMERLRFNLGRRTETLTLLCRRIVRPSGLIIFAAAAVGVRQHAASLPYSAHGTTSEVVAAPGPLSAAAPAVESLEDLKAALTRRLKGARSLRFVWHTDSDDVVLRASPELGDVIGTSVGQLEGHSFIELAERLGLDPDGRLVEVLRRRETFHGIEVMWPVNYGKFRVPVTLGALPIYNEDHRFDGFRGFGIVNIGRLAEAQPIESAEPVVAKAPPAKKAVADDLEPSPADMPAAPASAITDDHRNVVYLRLQSAERAEMDDNRPADKETTARRAIRQAASGESVQLTPSERNAFREIARALGARIEARAKPVFDRDEASPDRVRPIEAPAESDGGSAATQPNPAALEQALIDALPLAIAIGRDGRLLAVNKHFLALTGYADFAAVQAAGVWSRVALPVPATMADDGLLRVEGCTGEVVLQGRTGEVQWAGYPATLLAGVKLPPAETAQPHRGGELETRGREAEIRELHAILDTATDGVAVLDETGSLVSLNRSAEALFGYEQPDVAGQPFTILLASESHRTAQDYFEGLKLNGVASVLNDGRDVVGRERQGGAIPLFMTIGPIGSGVTPRYCVVMRDMTQWKKVERELNEAKRQAERASALKSDFLAKISHEIRTPLNAILGFAEVIMEERFGPIGNERYKDYLKDIHASGTHVMSLVNDLLDLSKIEAGKLELTFSSVDANRIVRECVSLMQPQASSERVIVRQALAPRLPNIVADERSLRQIVLNLLSNAMKYNEPGGQVIVSTALTDAGHAVIRIRDTGIGMSDSEIEMALEPFRQINTGRTSGTGLGLPLTKALVEANRASFTIKSKRKEGTLVEVAFPPTRVLAE